MNRSDNAALSTADQPRGLTIALEAFDQAAALQREARAAAGRPLVHEMGLPSIRTALLDFLETIPWQDAALDEPADQITADGGPWCATCLGARWVKLPHVGMPTMPRLVRCTDCLDSTLASSRNVLARHAGLTAAQRGKTFQNFLPLKHPDRAVALAVSQTVKLLAKWAQEPEGWLVLHGVAGSGKSHLGLAVANALIARLKQVRWFYAPDLVLRARERMFGEDKAAFFAWVKELRETPVLILDDLGAVHVGGDGWVVRDVLEPLMDARYRAKLPTLVTMMRDPQYVRDTLSESIGRRFQDPSVAIVIHHGAPQWSGEKAA